MAPHASHGTRPGDPKVPGRLGHRAAVLADSPLGQDQMEDTLTDAVFFALRYLPREVLGAWL